MDILQYKFLYIVLIFCTGLLAGLIPTLTGANNAHDRFFSLGNALGGGVFLGAGLIHLLPDAIDSYSGVLGTKWDYPIAPLICGAGFLLVLLIEKVIVGGDEDKLAAVAGKSENALYPYVLALVLSVHSFIAGMALGAEGHLATSLALFLAVIAHKGVAAFALGVGFQRSEIQRSQSIGIIALFSTMTPLGVLCGAVVSSLLSGKQLQLFEGTFDALAAGTFLYVAIADIVQGEFSKSRDLALKFAMMLIGLAVMALVAIWT